MAWATPQYTRTQVDAAGRALVEPLLVDADFEQKLAVINNWRSSHSFPLNTFQVGLRQKAKQVDPKSIVAQRIKRLSSIADKLIRFDSMKLSQMQDIGGCRAVVGSVHKVRNLVDLYIHSSLKHKLDRTNDYIASPKTSGYRGIHLIYRYYSDKKDTYNGLKIEVQLRTSLQHAWATAVETVGTFIRQALKSSQGEKEWLWFFSLMGTAIAFRKKTPPVPGTPTRPKELIAELRKHARSLEVNSRLRAYGAALRTMEHPGLEDSHYFLLQLEPSSGTVTVTGFKAHELEKAAAAYEAAERSVADSKALGSDAVLVSVESVGALRRAYPNYFLDTTVFINTLNEVLS